jgi:ketosteroid isomerase-like protein
MTARWATRVVLALSIGAAVAVLAVVFAAGGSSTSSASGQAVRRQADLWAIDRLEKNFHKATSRKNIELMMSLWAPNATFTAGGHSAVGRKQIREFWLTKSENFKPENTWVSETIPYKVRMTVDGDRGTLYFECHYVDAKTGKLERVTAADGDVARINGRWLITNLAGASATLSP